MQIESSGILCSAKINSNKACYTFSSFVSLKNGSILATARGGNNKDSEFEGIEFFRSDDEGENWSESWEPFKNVEIDNRSLKTIDDSKIPNPADFLSFT